MIRYRYGKNMNILFVGINPSPGTYERGIPFSNNKTFWYLLNKAGVIHEDMDDLRHDKTLKKIYVEKMLPVYHIGFSALITRPTRTVSQLKAGEEIEGRKRIESIIKKYKPKVVVCIGKVTFQKFAGQRTVHIGWQEPIEHSKVYLMSYPLHGSARARIAQLREIMKKIKH